MTIVLSFVSMIVLCMEEKDVWKKGHTWEAIDRCRDRWKDGKRGLDGSVVVLYILLSLPSVSQMMAYEKACGESCEQLSIVES